MGTSLDIKIKRANKVYHSGVSGVGGPAGFTVSRSSRTFGCPWAGQGRAAGSVRPEGPAPALQLSPPGSWNLRLSWVPGLSRRRDP